MPSRKRDSESRRVTSLSQTSVQSAESVITFISNVRTRKALKNSDNVGGLGALFALIFECLTFFWLRAAHIPQLDRSGKKGIKRQKRKNQMIGCSYGVFTLCALFLIAF